MKKTFPGALALAMEHAKILQIEVARQTGIAVSRINNYLQGKYRTIRPDHIDKIIGVVAINKSERARLAEAYVMDLLPDVAKGLVSIKADASDMGSWYLQRNRLPGAFATEFEDLYRLCVDHPTVRVRTSVWIELVKDSTKEKA